MSPGTEASHIELARVVREHSGRLAAALVSLIGDFAKAEDLVQDAVVAALQRWPAEGIPERPDAWLFTVARRRGLDMLRREDNYRTKLAQVQWPIQQAPDERLRLIFTCCHPALPRAAQIALTLRVVCGLTTDQIARAFLVREATVAQRITRAKRKITDARIPYRMPADDELASRLSEVLPCRPGRPAARARPARSGPCRRPPCPRADRQPCRTGVAEGTDWLDVSRLQCALVGPNALA